MQEAVVRLNDLSISSYSLTVEPSNQPFSAIKDFSY